MYKGAREIENTCSTCNDAGGNSELYGRGVEGPHYTRTDFLPNLS